MVTVPVRRAFAILSCLSISACERPSLRGSSEVQLGAAGAWETSYGEMAHRGIELAIEEMNRQGGINGRLVNVTFRDDQADGGLAADIAREFVDDSRIVGVM